MLQWHFSSEASSCPYAHFVAMALPRTQLLFQERPQSQLKHVHYLSGVRRTSFLLDKADHLQAWEDKLLLHSLRECVLQPRSRLALPCFGPEENSRNRNFGSQDCLNTV
jgi:hypothetical protein